MGDHSHPTQSNSTQFQSLRIDLIHVQLCGGFENAAIIWQIFKAQSIRLSCTYLVHVTAFSVDQQLRRCSFVVLSHVLMRHAVSSFLLCGEMSLHMRSALVSEFCTVINRVCLRPNY